MRNSIQAQKREEAATGAFNLRKFNAQKMLKGIAVKIAGKPLQGPWYYVFLNPKWILRAMPMPGNEGFGNPETVDHTDFWEHIVQSDIAPHYKIKDPRLVKQLQNLPYAMPRGRVVETLGMNHRPAWMAYHGMDFKYGRTEKVDILSQFNLLPQFSAGLVQFVPDDHEVIVKADFERFLSLVKGAAGMKNKVQTIPEPNFGDFDED